MITVGRQRMLWIGQAGKLSVTEVPQVRGRSGGLVGEGYGGWIAAGWCDIERTRSNRIADFNLIWKNKNGSALAGIHNRQGDVEYTTRLIGIVGVLGS